MRYNFLIIRWSGMGDIIMTLPAIKWLKDHFKNCHIFYLTDTAFAGIVENSGVGWLSPLDNPRRLAALIAELNDQRTELAQAAGQAKAFASRHTFEQTMDQRVEHMLMCCRDFEQELRQCRSSA